MPKMLRSRYEQGLAAYRAGLDLIHLHEIGEEIEKVAREATADPGPEYGYEAMPSLIAGYADGVIADIRQLASSPTAMRRGQKA